jgi:hypothetical protein
VCFGQYPPGKEPRMLHFQYENSGEDIFRYVLVERIPISKINVQTRRKAGEGHDEQPIVDSYLKWKDRTNLNS